MDTSRLNTPQFIYDDNECHVISYTPLMVTNNDGVTFAQTDPDSHYFTDLNIFYSMERHRLATVNDAT